MSKVLAILLLLDAGWMPAAGLQSARGAVDRVHSATGLANLRKAEADAAVEAFQHKPLPGFQTVNEHSTDFVDVYQLAGCGPEHAVHVAFVVCGNEAIHQFHTVLKSILAHRTRYLALHVVTDGSSMPHLHDVLLSWELPQFAWQFYDISSFEQELDSIPSIHPSSKFAMTKLLYHRILENTSRVIALDIDLIVNKDITYLWNEFEHFNQGQMFGIASQQSSWYETNDTSARNPRWPALGRGVNTGVWLIDLDKARAMDWESAWRTSAEDGLEKYGQARLADQDIVNYAITKHASIVHILPCTWNLQAHNTSVYLGQCLQEMPGPFIVHWNHPDKFDERMPKAELFLGLLQYYQKADGYAFRSGMLNCVTFQQDDFNGTAELGPKRDTINFRMQQASSLHYRVLPFYFSFGNWSASVPTLVTTLSMERLSLIPYLLDNWKGPISASLYVSDADIPEFEQFAKFTNISASNNLGIHLVMKSDDVFPINKMRSIAMKYAPTDMLFTVDVDLLPGPEVFQNLEQHTHSLKRGQALIVPAFESDSYKIDMPANKSEVLQEVDAGRLRVFRVREIVTGHRATRFDQWREAIEPYYVSWESDFEPYVLLNRSDTPTYNEDFVGFGRNKVSFIEDLHNKGIEFISAPDCYLVHFPHGPSRDLVLYRRNKQYRDYINSI